MDIKKFKPMLLPNELTGVAPDWDERIKDPSEWLESYKLDGGRVELFGDGRVLGRSLKEITSVHIQRMAKDISLIMQLRPECIIEAEFYSPSMNFAEIMHFFRSEDVTSPKKVKEYSSLWKTTKQGTIGIYKGEEYPVEEIDAQMMEFGAKVWPFPDRDLEWATTWHDDLKLYAFSYIDLDELDSQFLDRTNNLAFKIDAYNKKLNGLEPDLIYIDQRSFSSIDELYQRYDQAILAGAEGIVVTKKSTLYKMNRYSLKANEVFKIKDDAHIWDGEIIGVEESTLAREGSEKTINELGRSKTSQLQEDRVPSGMAKGFRVRLDDGQTMTVGLNGYDHDARKLLLEEEAKYIGKWIRFKGMQPVKVGGLPRHAIFTIGNFRDDK